MTTHRTRHQLVAAAIVVVLLLLENALVAAPASAAPGDCTSACYVDALNGDDALDHGTSAADAFKTIQKAIDTVSTGGTIHVAPGLYAPDYTQVTHGVVLLGAGAGVDPATRTASDPATESVIHSNLGLWITGQSAEVTIDGFSFEEKTAGTSTGILTGSGPMDVGAKVTVRNDIFSGVHSGISSLLVTNPSSYSISGNLFSAGGVAIALHGDHMATTTLAIDANHFANASGSAISVLVWSNATITNNTVQSETGGNDPIGVGGCDGCTISGNVVADSGGFESITLIGSDGASTNSTIENNSVTNPTRSDNYGIYIGLATGTTIHHNTITGAREAGIASDPGATITDNTITSVGGANTTGLYLRGASTGWTVTGNAISGAGVGIDIDPSAGSADTHVNRNSITGNSAGLTNRASVLAEATCNWWGSATGPGGQGPGSGNSVSANVSFTPWLLGSDLAGATCGVAPTPTPASTPTPLATSTPTVIPTSATPIPSATPRTEICDNCIDDDGDGLVDRDDPDCPPRADGLGAGVGDAGRAKSVLKCQTALSKSGTAFALKKQKLLLGCVAGLQKCLQLKPGDASCVAKASAKCAKLVATIPGLEAKLGADVRKSCAAPRLAASDLLDVAGIGFQAEAASCSDAGVAALTSAGDVVTCLARRHECEVERLLGLEAPRARELLGLAGVDPASLGCIVAGADGGGGGLGDAARGKTLTKCEKAVESASAVVVKQRIAGLQSCIGSVAKCLQQKPGDGDCVAKAQAKCAQLDAKLSGAKGPAAKAQASIAKACSSDLPDVLASAGLGESSAAAYCSALGVSGLTSVSDVAECLVRDHRCRVANLLDASIPRAAELLSRGGIAP